MTKQYLKLFEMDGIDLQFNKEAYDFNYDRIFNKEPKNEFEACRAKSKTFSMEQD